jgi:hypothetical protein
VIGATARQRSAVAPRRSRHTRACSRLPGQGRSCRAWRCGGLRGNPRRAGHGSSSWPSLRPALLHHPGPQQTHIIRPSALGFFLPKDRPSTWRSPPLGPRPYGAIRSTTRVGLDATLCPTTSIYRTLGRPSRSSACTYMRSKAATCPLMVVWTLGVHVAVWGS